MPDDAQLQQLLTQLLRAVSPAFGAGGPEKPASRPTNRATDGPVPGEPGSAVMTAAQIEAYAVPRAAAPGGTGADGAGAGGAGAGGAGAGGAGGGAGTAVPGLAVPGVEVPGLAVPGLVALSPRMSMQAVPRRPR